MSEKKSIKTKKSVREVKTSSRTFYLLSLDASKLNILRLRPPKSSFTILNFPIWINK